MKLDYEKAEEYQADAYQIGKRDVAWSILGWEMANNEDTEWSGYQERTGNLVAVMIGDDRHFSVDPSDVKEISADEFCNGCGQIGCGHGV
jgi:hypothetical protein